MFTRSLYSGVLLTAVSPRCKSILGHLYVTAWKLLVHGSDLLSVGIANTCLEVRCTLFSLLKLGAGVHRPDLEGGKPHLKVHLGVVHGHHEVSGLDHFGTSFL